MRPQKRHAKLHALLVATLGFVTAMTSPVIASAATLPVTAVNESGASCPNYSQYSNECHHWANAQQTISPGESVEFRNPYTGRPYHGLKFTEAKPESCPGITASVEGGFENWHGECTFTKPGVYSFYCTVHPTEMKGTITVLGTPTDETAHASGEAQTEATLNGSIHPQGNRVEYHFEYEGPGLPSKQSTPTTTLSATDFTSHSVSAHVMGLQPSATYHFRLMATYGAGKIAVAGATEQTFVTPAIAAPSVTTLAAEGLHETEATLQGSIDLGGETTEYFFEYGATTSYGLKTAKETLLVGGGDNQHVSAPLTSLAPGAEYHFRLVAKNAAGGPVAGVDRTFTTTSPPPPEQPPPAPPSKEPTSTPPTTGTQATVPVIASTLPKPVEGLATMSPPIAAGSLKLFEPPHSSSVRGSLDIASSGVGGRLEVALFAPRAELTSARPRHRAGVRVGVLRRAPVHAGVLRFAVALDTHARAALRRHGRLALTVAVTLTPPTGGPPTRVTREVMLRA